MSRRSLALLGGAALALAVVLVPPPPSQADGVLAAVGQSMGGARVMAIDALFLRAEAQRKAGRIEDAAALYRTVLDLDPANEAATIFLVNVYVDEMIPLIADPEQRHVWWLQARDLLETALTRRPDSAPLHARAAGILLDELQFRRVRPQATAEEDRAANRAALRHLERAVALQATLPRLGRVHLVQVALLAPEQAAQALRPEGRDPEHEALALRVGDEALRLRGDVLAEMRLEEEAEDSLRDVLETGLAAVRAVARGDRAAAEALLARCRALLPDWRLPEILEGVLGR